MGRDTLTRAWLKTTLEAWTSKEIIQRELNLASTACACTRFSILIQTTHSTSMCIGRPTIQTSVSTLRSPETCLKLQQRKVLFCPVVTKRAFMSTSQESGKLMQRSQLRRKTTTAISRHSKSSIQLVRTFTSTWATIWRGWEHLTTMCRIRWDSTPLRELTKWTSFSLDRASTLSLILDFKLAFSLLRTLTTSRTTGATLHWDCSYYWHFTSQFWVSCTMWRPKSQIT